MKEELNYNTLVIKFITGEISVSELEVLKAWLEKDPANRLIFDEENELWQESSIKTKSEHFKTEKAWSEISKQLGIGENKVRNMIILKKSNFRIIIAAASISCLLALGTIAQWLNGKEKNAPTAVTSTAINTEEGEKARIFLPDSTLVIINSGSTLEYTTAYNIDERVVKLRGEAYFDVKTNASKPFIVQLGKMTVCATGTKFNVFSYENEDRIETTLEEGKIHIIIKDNEKIEIKSGQQIVYFSKTNKTIVRDVPTETYTSWKENKLRFKDTPFEEVLRKISRRYNVVFEIRNKNLLDLKFTATFIDESIDDVMQMLKTVSPIKYTICNRTTVNDKQYLKPKIIIECGKNFVVNSDSKNNKLTQN